MNGGPSEFRGEVEIGGINYKWSNFMGQRRLKSKKHERQYVERVWKGLDPSAIPTMIFSLYDTETGKKKEVVKEMPENIKIRFKMSEVLSMIANEE